VTTLLRTILLALLLGLPRAGTAAETVWTWERLTQEVERGHPLMRAAEAGLDVYQAKVHQAAWAYFPRIQLETGLAPIPEVRDQGSGKEINWETWGIYYRVQVTVVQPVCTFGKVLHLQKAARRGLDVGRAEIEIARWDLRVRAAQAWYGKQLAAELDALLREGEKWLAKAHRRMERLRDQDAPEYDQSEHLRLKSRTSEFHKLDADNRLLTRVSHEGLRILLSLPTEAPVAVEPGELAPIAFELRPASRYLEAAHEAAPRMRLARAGKAAKDELAKARFAEIWPDLVLLSEAHYEGATVGDDLIATSDDPLVHLPVTALIGLRWNLNLPQNLLRAEEARAEARRAAEELGALEDLTELRVHELHQKLENAKRLIGAYLASHKAAQAWLATTWEVYEEGFGSFRDVMDALVQFYAQKLGYLQAVHSHNLLVWELGQLIGADPASIGEG
jgi:outer membrane protein TolC